MWLNKIKLLLLTLLLSISGRTLAHMMNLAIVKDAIDKTMQCPNDLI
jgi:hypothetical protein